jgi:hypothetical protein
VFWAGYHWGSGSEKSCWPVMKYSHEYNLSLCCFNQSLFFAEALFVHTTASISPLSQVESLPF